MDEQFLKNEIVTCDAVISLQDVEKGILARDERLVIMLSTGKKFMGVVKNFSYQLDNGHAKGKLEIIRYVKK